MKCRLRRLLVAVSAALLLSGCLSPAKPSGGSLPGSSAASPAKFPPGGVDHLWMVIDLSVEVFGIGKDVIRMEGGVVVHRGSGEGPDGREMRGDLVGAALRGNSGVFGPVVAIESPTQKSPCKYRWEGPGVYLGEFDINGWFFLPRHDLLLFTRKPVHVAGPAKVIPPVGQTAQATDLPVELYDFRKPEVQPVGSLLQARATLEALLSLEEDLKSKDATVSELKKG